MENNIIDMLFLSVRSALSEAPASNGESAHLSDDELFRVMQLAAKHDISHLVALGLKKGEFIDGSNETRLQQSIFKAVYRNEQMKYELRKISELLEQNKIFFIPLKGAIIRNYYPEPWMRLSCDIDILILEEDLGRAVDLLVSQLSYKVGDQPQYHDVSLYSQSGVHLELHFNIKENMNLADQLLADVWKNVDNNSDQGYCRRLTWDFFVFYHICHMAHHFIHGGCGVRPFIDMYIIMQKLSYDDEKVRKFLAMCNLEEFYNNVIYMTGVWFGDNLHNDRSRQMEEYVLTGGVYGSLENKVIVAQGVQGGKLKYALSRIFITFDSLKNYYPILKTKKWLFPFMQIRRWFRLVFGGNIKRSAQELAYNSQISKEKISKTNDLLQSIGLK